MGFILTVIFVILTIISPDQFGPQWANYHVLTILGFLIALVSLPKIVIHGHLRSSVQTYLLSGFIVAIGLSRIANGWYGGAIQSWLIFLPCAVMFFFIVANVTSTRRLKIMVWTVVGSCMVVAAEAICGYYFGFRGDMFVLWRGVFEHDNLVGEFIQIRGVGFVGDPNDFGQLLLIALPLVFLAWRRHDTCGNGLRVFLPAAMLLWAIYLTHSRGALVGLAVIALLEIRKRLPTAVSIALVIVLVAGVLALNFSGGRGISLAQGSDRLELWSTGLQLFKHAPIFGIGYGAFIDFSDITAHNSLMLCLAELGLVGSTLWLGLLVTTTLGLNRMIADKRKKKIGVAEIEAATPVVSREKMKAALVVPAHWISVMRLSFVSFITTSWFLSRSYSPTMYLILGLATATIALQRPPKEKRVLNHWILVTLTTEALAITVIYGLVRLRWALPN